MISESQFQKANEIGAQALGHRAGPERDAFVDTECGSDAALRDEVCSLLSALEDEALANAAALKVEDTSKRFGPYETVRPLGRGGMGVVYLGRRTDGQYQSLVAIKTINAALTDEQFESRFRAERQILASLNHPNIARLLDGGTEDRAPYLVMEYVEGEHLDRYCDAMRLPPRERIRLFLDVCSAVAYAHRNLVVHRDLKPSNILVDAAGVPHLVDFGVAKLLGVQGTDATKSAPLPVTARYASPEQLRAAPAATAGDQFSLGVILYELLTGAWPFGDAYTPLGAVERVIKETAAAPPANKITESAAEARGQTVQGLRKTLDRDLTTIVLKAIEADPERRYASVDELAADLRRHLEGRPVLARPQTIAYRARKFAQRQWIAVSLAAAAAAALVVGFVTTLQARRVAEQRFADVRSLAHYVQVDLDDGIAALPGSTSIRAAMAERSMRYLDALRAQAGSDPSLRLELAEGYLRLGGVWGNFFRANLGKPDQARTAYQKGLALAEELVRERPGDRQARRLLGKLEMDRALMESLASSGNDEVNRARNAIDVFSKLLQNGDGSAADHFELGRALSVFAAIRQQRGGLIATASAPGSEYQEAARRLERAVALAPNEGEFRMTLADLHERIAIAKGTLDPKEAIAEHVRATAIYDALPAPEREFMPRRLWLARVWMNRAWALGQAQQYEEAFLYLGKARPVLEQIASADPGNMRIQYDLTGLFRAWGIIANYDGRKREAIGRFASAIQIYDKLPQLTIPLRFLRAELIMRSALLHTELGEHEAARAKAADALREVRPLADKPDAQSTHLLATARLLSGEIARDLREPAAAVEYAKRAAILSQDDVDTQEILAHCLFAAGRRTEAIAALEKALALLPAPTPGQPPSRSRMGILEKLKTYRAGR